jgi:UDPglucose--hexose-1-phosphate uridylyltransferase
MGRPWLGDQSAPELSSTTSYDPDCYLCPGNRRANGETNPVYRGVYVFDNDFPALLPDTPDPHRGDELFHAEPARGACRVVCFSPDHAKTLTELDLEAVRDIVNLWREEEERLSAQFRHVQIFENRGAMMGCSNPHPHGQIWATSFAPTELDTEDRRQTAYFEAKGEAMLDRIVERERATGERVVLETERFLVIVPYWAAWPFETLLLPKIRAARFADLDESAALDLARALRLLTARYDNLFRCSFPYSMGFHGAPVGARAEAWRLHAHFYPPLLRSASIRKFMVGFEMLAEAQRDLTPESAAARLRAASDIHFRSSAAP